MKKILKKEVPRFLMLMLVTVILVCSCSLQAFAVDYNTDLYMMPYKLVEGFNIRFIPHEDFGQTSVDHMNHALYVWNQAMGEGFLSRDPEHTHPDTNYPSYDGESKVYRRNYGTSTFVAQLTPEDGGGILYAADIVFNMSFEWANSAQPGKYDVWTVFMHEAGHAVGIKDNPRWPDAVMYAIAYPNQEKRSLHDFDLAMIDAIYG